MDTLINSVSNWLLHHTVTPLFFDAWLKSVAVLAVAGGLCWVLRRAAAATRHWIWLLAMTTLPCLLLLQTVPHPWQRPLWTVSTGFDSGNQFSLVLVMAPLTETGDTGTAASRTGAAAIARYAHYTHSTNPVAAQFSTTWLVVAVVVWLIGAGLGLASVLAGRVQLSRLARTARVLRDADWARLLSEACETLRLRRPVKLLQSTENPMPLTWGWWRPVVLLPAEATHWPEERRRVVLLHELAHAKRWDCLTQTVARIVCALYWINPLVWLAARRMCVERERACDDLVLNSGCRASDYATHLVDIARSFRPVPQFAGIAMARSPQLQGRVAAIVDASRARRLRPLTAVAILLLMGALALSMGSSAASRSEAGADALRQQQLAQVQAFARAKEKQSEELAAKAGEKVSPEFRRFFAAAIKGDGPTVTNRFEYFKQHHGQYQHPTDATVPSLRTAYWQPVLELCLAYNQLLDCDPKYTALYADGIIDSIPAGSIYFGGTDPGRGVPTAFCKSHADADPFFTVTQNALADGTYLDYLRAMYGGRIYTPTGEDSQKCFQDYMTDAARRMEEHKLRPGEDVKVVGGKVEVAGQVAVMSINGLLTKVIFDHNTNREFYVEESFPLDWMYPYLEPHGLIMKINRQPLAQLPEEALARDREYWSKVVGGMVGDWLGEETTVREIADFVDRVYVRKDLKGFTGDVGFVRNECAQKEFSKLRASIGGIYAWRLNTEPKVCPPEYRPKSNAENQRIRKEADFAFRQAFAICPYSPEAVFRYAQLLLQERRFDDALLITETCLKLDPKNGQVRGLVENIKSFKKQSASYEQGQAAFARQEDEVRNNPTNYQAALDLASGYLGVAQTNRAVQLLNGVLNHSQADAGTLRSLVQAYNSCGNREGLQKAAEKLEALVRATPTNTQAALGLAEAYSRLQKPEAALPILDAALNDPKLDSEGALALASAYASLGYAPELEAAMERVTKVMPSNPEAWYDLAAVKAQIGKPTETVAALKQALELSDARLLADPKARDLRKNVRKDARFDALRQNPEFRKLETR